MRRKASGRKAPGLPSDRSDYGILVQRILRSRLHTALGPLTAGISPVTLASAYADWAGHLLRAPDRQIELAALAVQQWFRCLEAIPAGSTGPATPDGRFAAEAWRVWPFSAMQQAFLLTEQWWRRATTGIHGVSADHERMISFVARQWLDLLSPAGNPVTNPEVLQAARKTGGRSLVQGAAHAGEDWARAVYGAPFAGAEEFRPGRNLAVTPGKVLFRNSLMELIQYAPATGSVYPEPVLVVPAWLMKYYILDLSPGNSLVKYLTSKGHTVFMISWKNPGPEDRGVGLEDYRRQGIMAAMEVVEAVMPGRPVHATGYCLGGTLLASAAAAMARDGDERLATLTLFAAQTDFTRTGRLMLFIDEAQVDFLEDLMAGPGYLDFRPLTSVLRLMRSGELMGSAMVRDYVIGDRPPVSDLTAWTLDTTRLPAKAHSEYLRQLVIGNDLAEGRYPVDGRPVSLQDIRIPILSVGTLLDHVAPWESLYELNSQTGAELTFVLSGGGHNAGIVSPPGIEGRHFRIAGRDDFSARHGPQEWKAHAPRHCGSWWPFWQRWLAHHSGARGSPPPMGAPEKGIEPLCDAPGKYVLMT